MKIENKFEVADGVSTETETDRQIPKAANIGMLRDSGKVFGQMSQNLDEIDSSIDVIASHGERSVAVAARKMKSRLRQVEPSVTMIGQVKSGKTTLVNAMIGMPHLLPADVNPWTSVVTSIHLQKEQTPYCGKAVFRFFGEDEWDRLMSRGGRFGELAGRAGADDDLERVARQLESMREKSKRRLGRKFELMMGQEHKYNSFDEELIERYVCLGDDFETSYDLSPSQGRFADITKSADLYVYRPEFPMNLCIRDTPGVNDTFMMREQITIQAIRGSRTCVVVLSAHQAMSSVDLALVRLIANIQSRNVVIFVNRIDELTDPARQVEEIRASIRETIREHRGPEDAEIVFGSAYWATHALCGTLDQMDAASSAAMLLWAETQDIAWPEGDEGSATDRMIWELSGVPRLLEVLSDRLHRSIGREVADGVARSAINLASSLEASLVPTARPRIESNVIPLNPKSLPGELERIESRAIAELTEKFEALTGDFYHRLEHAHDGFTKRATAALTAHLEKNVEMTAWHYDPTGLRVLFRSAFQVYASRARSTINDVFENATAEVRELYARAFDLEDSTFSLEPPAIPEFPPPVILGKTIALDLGGGWWSRWWKRRRGYKAIAKDFSNMIHEETRSILDGLKEDYGDANRDAAEKILREFLSVQHNVLVELSTRSDVGEKDIAEFGFGEERQLKAEALKHAKKTLSKHVAPAEMETCR
ncbi:dynamin family protein [Aliiruegeria lutimaris]|uniref:Dynamin family protein n=1 Tax=Aliiruegeria lutimaris TaxID=571298 RepID=A0A1G8VFM4_9RHOB|nr:dynamin family protein [Aliiruegeria lutimaris]SDJ64714.1 Dynamin family protein [Aliiruegeria lutimaris]